MDKQLGAAWSVLALLAVCVGLVGGISECAAQVRIGVIDGEDYVRVLEALGYDCELLTADDLLEPAGLAQYRVLINPGARLSASRTDGLRAYVQAGGALFTGRIIYDLAGATYGHGGYGVGWYYAYRATAEHPITAGLPVGEWVQPPEELNRSSVRSVNALVPSTGLLLLEHRAQPTERKADGDQVTYVKTGEEKRWGWATAQGYGKGKVFCLAHYNLPRAIEFLGDNKAAAEPYERLLLNTIDWLASDDREGLPIMDAPPERPLKTWEGIDQVALPDSVDRTICCIAGGEFLANTPEQIAQRCREFNANTLFFFSNPGLLDEPGTLQASVKPEVVERLSALRQQGLKLAISFWRPKPNEVKVWAVDSAGKVSNRWPSWLDEGFRTYALHLVRIWAPLADYIGPDEWGLSPRSWSFDELSVARFKEKYGYTDADLETLKENTRAPTKLATDWWEFMVGVQDELLIAMAGEAKAANPNVKTAISYVTNERNWHGLGVRRAPAHYDVLYDCQFYWYGRWSDTPLNAALATKAIGWAKTLRHEYPDKELWVGWGPGYAGGKPTSGNQWWNHVSHYNNSPEEFFPYLASLYAASDKVFVFTIFNGNGPGAGSDKDFRSVSQLASKVVPLVREFKRGEIAYYWNPEENFNTWRAVGRPWAAQEGPVVPLGVLSEFADVDITGDLSVYDNLVVCGYYRPDESVVDYAGKNVFAWFNTQFDQTGAEIGSPLDPGGAALEQLAPAVHDVEGDAQAQTLLYDARHIPEPAHPLRHVVTDDGERVICARNEAGNVLLDTTNPWYLRQDAARVLIKQDLDHFGWVTRDCPQFVGTDRVVAFSLIEPRTAVVELPEPATKQVRLIKLVGEAGITQNTVVPWEARLSVQLDPYSVLVATPTRE